MCFKYLKLVIAILVFTAGESYAQPMTFQSKRLKYLYDQLEKQPKAPALQIQYIQEFPADKFTFIDVFDSHEDDQLTVMGSEYVQTFRKIGIDFPDLALLKSIRIGKDLPAWSAGPVAELQKGIYLMTHKNPQLFLDIVRELKKDEQTGLARFLYSSPDGNKNINFDILTDILEQAGEKKIRKRFSEASNTDNE